MERGCGWEPFCIVSVIFGSEGRDKNIHNQQEQIDFGNGITKCLLSRVTHAVRTVQKLIVEHQEVQSKTKMDRLSKATVVIDD